MWPCSHGNAVTVAPHGLNGARRACLFLLLQASSCDAIMPLSPSRLFCSCLTVALNLQISRHFSPKCISAVVAVYLLVSDVVWPELDGIDLALMHKFASLTEP